MLVEITIPVYNEEKILQKNVLKLINFLKQYPNIKYKITIADNCSTDTTWRIAQQLERQIKNIYAFKTNIKGRGNALREVWKKSKADTLCYVDADLSTGLTHLPQMIELIKCQKFSIQSMTGGRKPSFVGHSRKISEHAQEPPTVISDSIIPPVCNWRFLTDYDLVIGNRLDKNSKTKRRIYRTVLSKLYNKTVQLYFQINLNDIQCGFKAIKKDVFLKLEPYLQDKGWFFDTELVVWAVKKKFKVKEIPITWVERKDSRVRVFSTIIKYLKGLRRLKKALKNERLL